ncbi:C40 family peptidase [uncultured Pseudokineococcus sp.]|uniref:C40 family peptidase n=1 Tax=uncultured Pseudokineococcus sp. TaxID=1642928 RepID=UPI0026300E05|nr:C40 family peptidase [uncultured Pseudokineococcus sp.]
MPLHAPARHRARHAAPGPVSTPFTGLQQAVAARAGVVARRGVVIGASTGLVLTLGTSASVAEPREDAPRPAPALTAPAERLETAAPVATEALTVAADVPVTFARGAALGVIAPPPPPPPPAPVVVADADEPADETSSDEGSSSEESSDRGTESTSRSAERSAPAPADQAAEPEAAPAPEPEPAPAPEPEPAPAAASSAGGSVLDIAAQYVGTPYSYGGTTPAGFDCSGFTQYVFAQAGISLPRTAAAQGAAGQRVSRSEAQPGDLAVVSDGSHVGIYAGGNQWYDSPRPGKSVSLRDMWTSDVYFVRY